MHLYQIYGLQLRSNIALPGPVLTPALRRDIPPVKVVLGELPNLLSGGNQPKSSAPNWFTTPNRTGNPDEVPVLQVWRLNSDRHFYFRYCDGVTFVVSRQGDEIWATWPDDLTLEDTATYLLGPILGFVQRLRGTVCLHASAVVIDEQVAVFVGVAGAGKSTTAAAFAQQGYPVLSDDVVPLVDLGSTFLIQPAYPRIRLWDTSVSALYGTADALPRIVPSHPFWDKRYLDLTQAGYSFQQKPLPLAAIYCLTPRSDEPHCPQIEPMTRQAQIINLIANTYTNYLLDKEQRAQELELLSRVVQHIPVRKITAHSDPKRIPQFLEIVRKDMSVAVPV